MVLVTMSVNTHVKDSFLVKLGNTLVLGIVTNETCSLESFTQTRLVREWLVIIHVVTSIQQLGSN